jgi:hypothetical protein
MWSTATEPEPNLEAGLQVRLGDVHVPQTPSAQSYRWAVPGRFALLFNCLVLHEGYRPILSAVRRICPASTAAPKPLSMFITPMPAAQELSMVSKGARPLKFAP